MSILNRTFHPDEANQAFTTGRLLETGTYSYNPQDHHGPTLYYAAATLQKAAGHNSTATLDPILLRCTPILFAVLALVFGALAVRKITGRRWHGLLFALLLGTSPLFVFFATDFIQEMLLAAFTMMMLWSALGMLKSLKVQKFKSSALDVDRNSTTQPSTSQPSTLNSQPSKLKPGTWALLFGIAAGLAFATKETVLLTFAAAGISTFIVFVTLKRKAPTANCQLPTTNYQLPTILAIAGFTLTSILLYSSFASNWQGVYNAFIAAPLSYIHRAAGDSVSQGAAAHVHPWWQYLKWLIDGNEGLFAVIVALPMGLLALLAKDTRSLVPSSYRTTFIFASIYSAALVALYSMIPYKTPWCALQILPGLLLVVILGPLLFIRTLHSTYESKLLPHHNGKRLWGKIWCYVAFLAIYGSVLSCNIKEVIRINRDPDSKDIPYNYASASPQVQDLATLIIESLKVSEFESLKVSGGESLKDATVQTLKPSNPQTHKPSNLQTFKPSNPFVAVALPPEDTWPLPFYLRSIQDKVGYWTQFGELEALAGLGQKPTVVVVPAEEGHLVQPLFPHLKNTKRFEMRPHVRVRAFW